MTSLDELDERLEKGLFVDNLYEMANSCRMLAMDTDIPLPLFVIRHLFLEIAHDWEDRPVTVEEAKPVQSALIQPIHNLIKAIKAGSPAANIYDSLNQIISTYLVAADTI